mmetsp:Transcript_15026/g.20406  ORF Transcript_15026/g.20406 Transcript_15026/m.20406 type:complete len:202 (+) Transcript_15026:1314-1919(+)
MWVCRPRKEWPPYFTLSINELPGMEQGNNAGASVLPSSLTALVSDKFLFDQDADDDKKSVGSIGSDELVCIVNPNNYTLEVDDFGDFGEVSAFDPDIIEEETDSLKMSREDLLRGIRDGSHNLQENHVMAELVLGVRDKKQARKLKKERAEKSQSKVRSSLYNRLFKSRDAGQVRASASVSSDSSSSDDESHAPPLNSSGD